MNKENKIHMESLLDSFIPEYNHKSGMFLCMSGTAEVLINNAIYRLEKGVLYIVSPLVTIHYISKDSDFEGVHILDDWEIFYPAIQPIIDTILQLKLRDTPCLQLNKMDIDFFISRGDLIEEKRKEMEGATIAEEKKLILHMIRLLEQETMLEIIRIYFRNKPVESHPMDKKETIIYNFFSSLFFNFKQQRSVMFYAKEAHLSPNYFTAIIKDKTGHTPSEWIIDITITQAKLLLEKTKKSIKEIADDLNFPEQFTFRKYFKQHVGIAPKEYRTNNSCKG